MVLPHFLFANDKHRTSATLEEDKGLPSRRRRKPEGSRASAEKPALPLHRREEGTPFSTPLAPSTRAGVETVFFQENVPRALGPAGGGSWAECLGPGLGAPTLAPRPPGGRACRSGHRRPGCADAAPSVGPRAVGTQKEAAGSRLSLRQGTDTLGAPPWGPNRLAKPRPLMPAHWGPGIPRWELGGNTRWVRRGAEGRAGSQDGLSGGCGQGLRVPFC